ncbi:GAF domain-containing protein [Paenibacillus sp. GSMTC-2017]|uniref:GAF domain-containing protein n=1 Tax=Paenibacillus sp. GSMTC-2017 TaxID=2794350 RepID=UPI0018D65D83|nr:GAF domain-containing protein [Paenibacillus sp. GSMTC-2017]MBH5320297.1 GAF domain-containing protein [Paenibacillus sp. GSMTC-2017]
MESLESTFILELNRLRGELSSDFCALAMLDVDGFTLKWKLASGNENERFRKMTFRYGKGLSDTVVKVGRAVSLNLTDIISSRQVHEYPILIAESLRSAYAVPLQDGIKVIGVLLVGDRKNRIYRVDEKRVVLQAGVRMSAVISHSSPNRILLN